MTTQDALREARELLRELRADCEFRRRAFGNPNLMSYEPGWANDAKRDMEKIDAFLARLVDAPCEACNGTGVIASVCACPDCAEEESRA